VVGGCFVVGGFFVFEGSEQEAGGVSGMVRRPRIKSIA
jgi:hypothetical protein